MSGITATDVHARAVAEHGEDHVGVYELACTYEALQTMTGRRQTGVFYTPAPVTEAMTQLALQLGLGQCGDTPSQVLRILALDPACGCGQYLVEAARLLSYEYARRLIGVDPAIDLVVAVMPKVILECIFGMDIDPVAVDLAKLALSIETGGTLTPAMLEGHFKVGNTVDGPDGPPALEERIRRRKQSDQTAESDTPPEGPSQLTLADAEAKP